MAKIVLLILFCYGLCYSQSRYFDGTDDYIHIATNSLTSDNITVEAWVNLEASGSFPSVYTQADASWQGLVFQFENSSRRINLWLGNRNETWTMVTTAVPLNTWAHISASFDGDIIRFYLNGNADGTVDTLTNGAIGWGNDPWYIGKRRDGYFLQGKIDNVRLWNYARSQKQIKSNMYKTIRGKVPGLLASFVFDEKTGGVRGLDVDRNTTSAIGTLTGKNAQVLPMVKSDK